MKLISNNFSETRWGKRYNLISAFIKGENIQLYNINKGTWEDSSNFDESYPIGMYRIKPDLEVNFYSIYKHKIGTLIILTDSGMPTDNGPCKGVAILHSNDPKYNDSKYNPPGCLTLCVIIKNESYWVCEFEDRDNLMMKVGGLFDESK